MKKRTGLVSAGIVAIVAVLFLFSYSSVTGLASSMLSKTSVYYNDGGLPARELTVYPDGVLEITYGWDGARLVNMSVKIKNSDGGVDTNFVINRSEKEWEDHLDRIEQKAWQKKISRFERTYRKFLITTRLGR